MRSRKAPYTSKQQGRFDMNRPCCFSRPAVLRLRGFRRGRQARFVLAEHREQHGAQRAENARGYEIGRGRDVPQKRARQCREGHHNVPQQVVGAEHAGLAPLRREFDNQRLAGGLPELFQAADDERDDERRHGFGKQQHHGEYRKESEGNGNQGF
ncbi:hypothetical protein SDC9_211248 [bioreactor metagenome]|uniref:Uncharacterized protein n=1 Tax=bioreactor metagenome TaxID=1076179 RepID=A0A645JL92_9ZZZZ